MLLACLAPRSHSRSPKIFQVIIVYRHGLPTKEESLSDETEGLELFGVLNDQDSQLANIFFSYSLERKLSSSLL